MIIFANYCLCSLCRNTFNSIQVICYISRKRALEEQSWSSCLPNIGLGWELIWPRDRIDISKERVLHRLRPSVTQLWTFCFDSMVLLFFVAFYRGCFFLGKMLMGPLSSTQNNFQAPCHRGLTWLQIRSTGWLGALFCSIPSPPQPKKYAEKNLGRGVVFAPLCRPLYSLLTQTVPMISFFSHVTTNISLAFVPRFSSRNMYVYEHCII